MKRFLVVLVLAVIGVIGGIYLISTKKSGSEQSKSSVSPTQTQTSTFVTPKKSAHYESNTPEHATTLAGVPINVVINFNFDLAANSSISIKKDGKEYGVGQLTIDENKLSMRKKMDPAAPDGTYTVEYLACWPDKTCHDGNFQFAIDRTKSSNYQDMRNQKEITINLSDIAFDPKDIRISRGTKVTWVNNDTVEHYVNTDSHPAHTYYLEQNSKVLGEGDTYSLTLDTAGIYPYHCSAHEASMKASILVD